MHATLSKDRNSAEHLERLLAETRQASVEQRLLNEELQAEIQSLKNKSEDLQNRL